MKSSESRMLARHYIQEQAFWMRRTITSVQLASGFGLVSILTGAAQSPDPKAFLGVLSDTAIAFAAALVLSGFGGRIQGLISYVGFRRAAAGYTTLSWPGVVLETLRVITLTSATVAFVAGIALAVFQIRG